MFFYYKTINTMSPRFSLILLCLFLASPMSKAGPADPLWLAATETLRASRDLVASEVEFNNVVTDADGKRLDTIRKTTKLSGWRDGEPVRTTVKMVDTEKTGLSELKFESGIANHPEEALLDATNIVRAGPGTLDGKTAMLFQLTGIRRKRPFTAKVWIDEASSLPLRADYAFKDVPMTKSMNVSVRFGRDGQARWLPLKVDIDVTVSAMFHQFRVQSAQQLSNWVKRP
jgi:hypothetical protein